MTKHIGRRIDVGLARETSRGVTLAPKLYLRHTALDFEEQFENIASEAGVGRIEQANQSHLTRRMSGGTIEGEIGSTSFGLFLYSLLGTLVTTIDSPVAGANSHAFSLAQTNQHALLALTKQDPDRTRIMTVMPNSLTIKVEPGSIVTYTVDLIGLGGNDFTTQSVTYPADLKFLSRGMIFKVASNIAGLGAASAVDLKSLELTITQNAAVDDTLSSVQGIDIINQQFDITGNIELTYSDTTWRDYVDANTNRAMEVKFTSDGYVTGTTPATLDFQFPNVQFSEWESSGDLDALRTQKLNFRAMYDRANSQAAITTCTLVNGETGSNY